MRFFANVLLPHLRDMNDRAEGKKSALDLLRIVNQVAANRRFGDDSSYSEFSSKGLMVNTGSARTWNDLPPVPILSTRLPAASAPTLTTLTGNIQQYTFAVNDYVYGNYELTHEYAQGTDLHPHVHWATNGTNTTARGVKWELEYTISNATPATDTVWPAYFPASATITVESSIPANTTSLSHAISSLPVITLPALRIGAYIAYRFRRVTATGTAPTSNPFGLALGFHVLQDTQGSDEIGTKGVG